jgi:putative Mn2+ efflux pump MntP
MTLWQTVAIAVALGMDCLGVSAAMAVANPTRTVAILSCLLFGIFQSGMALSGMIGGSRLVTYVSSPLRLAPPVVLALIGVLMILKGIRSGQPTLKVPGIIAILGAAIAVSVDALGVGAALGMIGEVSLAAVAIIGVIATGLSAVGFAGGRLLSRYTNLTESAGGMVLIVLAGLMLLYRL